MSDTYVLVHGAWHTGEELEHAAKQIRKPATRSTARPWPATVPATKEPHGLMEAARSLEAFFDEAPERRGAHGPLLWRHGDHAADGLAPERIRGWSI